jgi:cytochrome c-type biogenesis protein CcmH/NrfG
VTASDPRPRAGDRADPRRPAGGARPILTVTGDHLLGLAIGLAVGLLFGFQIGRAGRVLKDREPVMAAPVAATPAPPAPQDAGGAVPLDAAEQLAAARQVTDQDPKNVRAWITLGNLYFDTHQPQKSIDAYARALELQPDNPDVLTDQGVMLRAVGAFDKAVANFQKANRIDPKHLQSLYNMGVVYAFDLKDVPKAEEAWNRVIQLAPQSENASQAREALAKLKKK